MKVKKVLIYSRHGLRYPLINNEELKDFLPSEMLDWEFQHSILTEKGEQLEYAFGKSLKRYLDELGINFKTKKVFANSMPRTVLTSKLLTLSMFPYESIDIDYKHKNFENVDLNFDLTLDEKNINLEKIKKMDERLKEAYNKLENILGIEKNKFINISSDVKVTKNGIIDLKGAFRLGTDIIDMFIIKYYEGFPLNKIFKSEDFTKDLKEIVPIRNALLDEIYGDKKYIENSKLNAYNLLKKYLSMDNDYTLLVGHDSNIATILSMLEVPLDNLGNDFEKYPISSKLIFKVYEDESFDLDIMYHEVENIRNMDMENPTILNLGKKLRLK